MVRIVFNFLNIIFPFNLLYYLQQSPSLPVNGTHSTKNFNEIPNQKLTLTAQGVPDL